MVGLKALLSDQMRGQLGRFVVVGMGNTAFSYAVYSLGLFLRLPYWLASLIALVLGIAVSFVMQGRLVFRSSLSGRLSVFLAVWAFIYGVNILLIRLLAGMGLDFYSSGALALVPTVALSFLMNRVFVFRQT